MAVSETTLELTSDERSQYKQWLEEALQGVREYNGSEEREQRLLAPLMAIDAFVINKNQGITSSELEQAFAKQAWPENAQAWQSITNLLQNATDNHFNKLQQAPDYQAALSLLVQGGGVVKRHTELFVQTDEGSIQAASTEQPNSFDFKTQPRLAMLLQHLKDIGIYTDDIIAHVCTPDPGMVRQLPYIVLHIPRLDKEIAVCDEVGEITFVADKSLGTDVWASLSKDQLKARPEVTAVRFTDEADWWAGIRQVLAEEKRAPGPKIDVQDAAGKKPPLDLGLIKQSILAHRHATGTWPTQNSGPVRYGPYAGKTSWSAFENALYQGLRGLPGGSSLADLNAEASAEHGLDYVNLFKQENYDINLIKQSIFIHHQETGTWPRRNSGPVRYGPYAGKTSWSAFENALYQGLRGLPGGSSLADLNAEASAEHGLDYINPFTQENYDINLIKQSIRAHRQETGTWPKQSSDPVLYGPYAGKSKWNALEMALYQGLRGLPGGSTLPDLNAEVSAEHGLDYVNPLKQGNYDINLIKQSVLVHRQQTGKWPTASSGSVQYGPYADKIKWGSLGDALSRGSRGLTGGSSLSNVNAEVSAEHGLDYVKKKGLA